MPRPVLERQPQRPPAPPGDWVRQHEAELAALTGTRAGAPEPEPALPFELPAFVRPALTALPVLGMAAGFFPRGPHAPRAGARAASRLAEDVGLPAEELAAKYLPDAERVIRAKFRLTPPDLREELIAEGHVGLVKAAQRWDRQREFGPFMSGYVEGAAREFLRRGDVVSRAERAELRRSGLEGPRVESIEAQTFERRMRPLVEPQARGEGTTDPRYAEFERQLGLLPERDRRIFEMRFDQDATEKEISAAFGKSESWASKQLSRIVGGLRWSLTAPQGPADLTARGKGAAAGRGGIRAPLDAGEARGAVPGGDAGGAGPPGAGPDLDRAKRQRLFQAFAPVLGIPAHPLSGPPDDKRLEKLGEEALAWLARLGRSAGGFAAQFVPRGREPTGPIPLLGTGPGFLESLPAFARGAAQAFPPTAFAGLGATELAIRERSRKYEEQGYPPAAARAIATTEEIEERARAIAPVAGGLIIPAAAAVTGAAVAGEAQRALGIAPESLARGERIFETALPSGTLGREAVEFSIPEVGPAAALGLRALRRGRVPQLPPPAAEPRPSEAAPLAERGPEVLRPPAEAGVQPAAVSAAAPDIGAAPRPGGLRDLVAAENDAVRSLEAERRTLMPRALAGDEAARQRVVELEQEINLRRQAIARSATDEEIRAQFGQRTEVELIDDKGRQNFIAQEAVRRGLADEGPTLRGFSESGEPIYNETVRVARLKPTGGEIALPQTAAREEIGALPTPREALIPEPDFTKIARARAQAEREAITEVQRRVEEVSRKSIDELTEVVEGVKEPRAIRFSTALEKRAKEIERTFAGTKYRYVAGPELKAETRAGAGFEAVEIKQAPGGVGKLTKRAGVKRRDTEEFTRFKAEQSEPLRALASRIRAIVNRLSDVKVSRWEQLDVRDQAREISRRYPELDFTDYRDAVLKSGTPEERAAAAEAANDYLRSANEVIAQSPDPLESLKEYPLLGQADVGTVVAERERALVELSGLLEEARARGVSKETIDPLARLTTKAMGEIRELTKGIRAIRRPVVPEEVRRAWTKDEQLIYDYASQNPEKLSDLTKWLLAITIRKDPERFLRATARLSIRDQQLMSLEIAQRFGLAEATGGDLVRAAERLLEELRAKAPTRGSIGPLLHAAKEAADYVAVESWRIHAEGGPVEDFERLVAAFISLEDDIAGGSSEIGRALNLARLSHGVAAERQVQEAERVAKEWTRRLEDITREWKKELERAEAAAVRYEREAAKGVTPETARELEAAQARAEQLRIQREDIADKLRDARDRAMRERMKALVQALRRARRKGLATPQDIRTIMSLNPQTELDKITVAIRSLYKMTDAERQLAIVMNAVYSNPRALVDNTVGNALRLSEFFHADPLAAAYAKARSQVTGRPPALAFVDLQFAYAAMATGVREAVGIAVRAVKEGIDTIPVGDLPEFSKFEIGRADPFPGFAGVVWTSALRVLTGVDAAFSHVIRGMESEGLRAAYARRVLGAQDFPEIARRVAELRVTASEGWLQDAAQSLAADRTYRNALDGFFRKIVDIANFPTVPFALRFNERGVPVGVRFDQRVAYQKALLTPIMFAANSVKFGAKVAAGNLPSIVRAEMRLRKVEDFTPEQLLVMERAAERAGGLGLLVALIYTEAFHAYKSGDLTGDVPRNPADMEEWRRRGIEPNSRRMPNGEWQDYTRFWPVSILWSVPARFGDAIRDGTLKGEETPTLLARAIFASSEELIQFRFLRQMAALYDNWRIVAEHGFTPAVQRWVATNLEPLFVPYSSGLAEASRMVDPYERDPQTIVEALEARVPILSRYVRPKTDRWGRAVERDITGLERLSPLSTARKPKPDPTDDEVTRLEHTMGPDGTTPLLGRISFPSSDLAGIDLDPDQYFRYKQLAGTLSHDAVTRLIATSRFQRMNDRDRADEIRPLVDAKRREARVLLASEMIVDRDGKTQVAGLRIGLAAAGRSTYQRVKLMERVLPEIERSPELQQAFQLYRGKEDDLTLGQYRQLIPLVRWLEQQPEFADDKGNPVGSPSAWQRYHEECREYERLRSRGLLVQAQVYLATHATLGFYRALSQREFGKNPRVTLARKLYPLLRRVQLPSDEERSE